MSNIKDQISKIRKIVRKINEVFVSIILTFFYFFGIGIANLIYRIFNRKVKVADTYWSSAEKNYDDKKYFESPY